MTHKMSISIHVITGLLEQKKYEDLFEENQVLEIHLYIHI